ncbi:MAG: hypothetical protein ACKO50_11805 [Cyanobium sp.]
MSMSSSHPVLAGHAAAAPEAAWQIARPFPAQGEWTDECYLSFTESLSQLCELVDGRVGVPEAPTKTHQQIVHALLAALLKVSPVNGTSATMPTGISELMGGW